MQGFVKKYWKTLAFFGVVGLVGGFFTGLYVLDSYPESIRQQLVAELSAYDLGVSIELFIALVSAMQSVIYGVLLGGIGIFLGKKVGLWKDEKTFTRKALMAAVLVGVLGGIAIILPDLLFFGKYNQAIADSYRAKPTVALILASVLYGGVIEEVMLRLFMLSLVAFLLHKLLGKGKEKPATWVLVLSNVIAALLFAAGHLPTTFLIIGNSPMILFRCFLLNGGIGLLFGWLYRKYGLRYAMIAHGGCHMVSKLIWILFV